MYAPGRVLFTVSVLVLLSGCASYGVIENTPIATPRSEDGYSVRTFTARSSHGETAITVALSGGGTRAAALSYGVLKEMRDTPWQGGDGGAQNFLAEVDTISSVSGGSFTAAYYGLFGERLFEDFEEKFLRKDVQGSLVRGLFNPFRWFSSSGRTELAVETYNRELFEDATYADMLKRDDLPLIIVNASDLGYGVRFSFTQDYFNFLCSDLSTYPVARAVTASSAVPIVFNPVVLENYPDCGTTPPEWLLAAKKRALEKGSLRLEGLVSGLETYYDKDTRKYAHFVDGGITDNLGLLALFDYIAVAGGPESFIKKTGRALPTHVVLISVDASTSPKPEMDESNKHPSLSETVGAVSNVQLHRYNIATDELIIAAAQEWSEALSTPGQPVEIYLIRISLEELDDEEDQKFFNQVPTSFSLTDDQVDRLIAVGGQLLRDDPEFQRLLADVNDGTVTN